RHKGSAVFASTTAFLLIAALVYFADYTRKGDEAINSVAVLHFINQGDDPSTEYLSEGISHSIIKRLSRLPNLKVVSLNSALRYKGQQIDPKAVGEELNVRAVLAGRMTRQGDALAISAELVDVRDNRRLWAEQYNNTPASDILGVQEKISEVIAEKLRGRLSGQETKLLTKRYTESTEAYDAYARGHYLLEKRTGPTTEKSIEYFEHAIKLDPNYALAYAELGFAYWSIRKNRSPEDHLLKANEAVMKALQIDDQLAEAYTTLGHIRSSYWDWTGAENAFRRGVELNPNSAFAHTHYAFYFIAMRRFDEAVAESKRAVELEPTSVFYNRNVALNLYFARRYDEAIEQSLKTLELDPVMPTAHVWLGKSYQQKGLYGQAIDSYLKDTPLYKSLGVEAKATLKDAYAKFGWKDFWRKLIEFRLEQAKHEGVDAYGLAEAYAQLGNKDQLFAWLEKAYQLRYITINFLSVDPLWDFVRSDPRYVDLIRRMGLEP
ncbi:MAG TPA: FlgO family outer membrane protein, partial [Pyrinomonadaceae bacterium]